MVKKITGGKNIVRVRTANATLPGDRVRVKAKRRGGTGAVIAAGLFLGLIFWAGQVPSNLGNMLRVIVKNRQ